MTEQSASQNKLGYIYQIDYALYVLLNQSDHPKTSLFIEKLDDIEVHNGNDILECIQLKRTVEPLKDSSRDLWKTIFNWIKLIDDGKISLFDTLLVLASTAKTPNGHIATLLRPDDSRNTSEALKLLCEKSKDTLKDGKEPEKNTIGYYKKKFYNLSDDDKKKLVDAIRILDESPDFDNLKEKIKNSFNNVRDYHKDKFYDELMGWWHGKVVQHLQNKSQTPLQKCVLDDRLCVIRDGFVPDKLLEHYGKESPPIPPEVASGEMLFIRQLDVIGLRRSLEDAKQDFVKASLQRSKWINERPEIAEDLIQHDKKLIAEWSSQRNIILDDFDNNNDINIDEATEQKQKELGRLIYKKIYDFVEPIRFVLEQYITRGSYHILANKLKVGWHPQFAELFNQEEHE